MDQDTESRIVEAKGEAEQAAMRCLIRMRGEGKPLAEMPAILEAETGIALTPEAIDRILRAIAGPAPRETGGDPEFFSGYLGGG